MSSSKKPKKDQDRDAFSLCSDFVSELDDANDRAKAIVAAAALDEILARLLANAFIDDKIATKLIRGGNAPLGTFSARIDAAYGLGLISDDQKKHLTIIRKIRNEFAHRVNCTFEERQIEDRCRELDLKHIIYPPGKESDAETRFVMNASGLCGQIQMQLQNWVQKGFHPSQGF